LGTAGHVDDDGIIGVVIFDASGDFGIKQLFVS
jgi:hypothetical protein